MELQFGGVYKTEYPHLVLQPGQNMIVRGTINDADAAGYYPVAVVFGPNGIEIKIEGYGEKCAADGHGSPVFFEVYNGVPVVRVWEDINDEEATSIELTGASESLREDDEQ